MKKLLLVITTFFLTILGTSPALAADQDVSFSTANARNIPKKINGINQNWFVTTPIQYNFNREAFNQLNTNLIRFPGGVIGNFYDWRTFAPDWKAASRLFADEPGRAEAIKRVFDSYVKTLDPITFITTVKNLRKNVIITVNIYSNTPDEIAAGLTKLKDAGIVVNYIELGNEMYRHTDIATYLRKAKATARKVRELFPQAQIGIVGDRDDWTGNPDFDWQVPNADWFDAVIYHPFSGSGKRLNDEKQKKHILFDIPEKISNLVNKTREQYPDKKLWFTEWNIWEPANDGYFMTETYSYAVYHYNFLLNILKYPSITIANVHNLWHTSKQFSLLYPKQAIIDQYYNNGVNPPNNTYSFDQFFVKSPSYWPTLWIGQAFAAYNKFTIVDNSNIIAAYFFDSKQPGKGSIAIINRTGQSQKITFRGIDNISRTASILAKDWLEPSSEANEMRPETRTMTTNTLALAPYAIAYLSSRGGSLPTPTPTATPQPPSGCNQPCNYTIYPPITCQKGLICAPQSELRGAPGLCRNPACPNKTSCQCPTPTPTPTPTATPQPPSGCNQPCNYTIYPPITCQKGLICVLQSELRGAPGLCRNSACPNETSCRCPTPTPTPLSGDLDSNNIVDLKDLQIIKKDFGKTGSPGWIDADIIKNGKVDLFDYNVLVGNFGK